eukprot:4200568-Pyramimonas_sp.AAC.1
MFYRQEQHIFCLIDRCIRCCAGLDIPDNTMTSILDACHQCWMQTGPAKVFYSDGGGALTDVAAKAVLKAEGTELRIRARGLHAATNEARSGRLRHLLRAMEAELN